MFKIVRKRKVDFIEAVCPRCGGNLELDSNMEIAHCSRCHLRCVIDDNLDKNSKLKTIDKFIGLFERQQNIKREYEKEKREQDLLERRRQEIQSNKITIGSIVLFIFIIVIIILMSMIEKM